jgi:hypothetical protein
VVDQRKSTPQIEWDELFELVSKHGTFWKRFTRARLDPGLGLREICALDTDVVGLTLHRTTVDLIRAYAKRNTRIKSCDIEYYQNAAACLVGAAAGDLLVRLGVLQREGTDDDNMIELVEWYIPWLAAHNTRGLGLRVDHDVEYEKERGAPLAPGVVALNLEIGDSLYEDVEVNMKPFRAARRLECPDEPVDELELAGDALAYLDDDSNMLYLNGDGRVQVGVSQARDRLRAGGVREMTDPNGCMDEFEGASPDVVDEAARREVFEMVDAARQAILAEEGDPLRSEIAERLGEIVSSQGLQRDLARRYGVDDSTVSRKVKLMRQQLADSVPEPKDD